MNKQFFTVLVIFMMIVPISMAQTHDGSFDTWVQTLFAADGKTAITIQPENWDITYWDIPTGDKFRETQDAWVQEIQLNADNSKIIAQYSNDGFNLYTYDFETGEKLSSRITMLYKCKWVSSEGDTIFSYVEDYQKTLLRAFNTDNKLIWSYVLEDDDKVSIDHIRYLKRKNAFVYQWYKPGKDVIVYQLAVGSDKPIKLKTGGECYGYMNVNRAETQILFCNGSLYDIETGKLVYSKVSTLDNDYFKYFFDHDSKIMSLNKRGLLEIFDSKTGDKSGGYSLPSAGNATDEFSISGYDPEHDLLAYTNPRNTVHIVRLSTGEKIIDLTKCNMIPNPFLRAGVGSANKGSVDWSKYVEPGMIYDIETIMPLLDESFKDGDWQELIYKYNFKYNGNFDDHYSSPDGKISLSRNKGWQYLSAISIATSNIKNLDIMGINTGMSWDDLAAKFGKPYQGNWLQGFNTEKYSFPIACYTGDDDVEVNRLTITCGFDGYGKTMNSISIYPLNFEEFSYKGSLHVIRFGCRQGDCAIGDGVYQWISGERYSGSFRDGSIYKGKFYRTVFDYKPFYEIADVTGENLIKFMDALKSYNKWANMRHEKIMNMSKNQANADSEYKSAKLYHSICIDELDKALNLILDAKEYLETIKVLKCDYAVKTMAGLANTVSAIKYTEQRQVAHIIESRGRALESYYTALTELDELIKKVNLDTVKKQLADCGYMK